MKKLKKTKDIFWRGASRRAGYCVQLLRNARNRRFDFCFKYD